MTKASYFYSSMLQIVIKILGNINEKAHFSKKIHIYIYMYIISTEYIYIYRNFEGLVLKTNNESHFKLLPLKW